MAILNGLTGPSGRAFGHLAAIWLGEGGEGGDQREAVRPASSQRAGRSVPHVLIVEDELLIAWHLETLVESLNHHVCAMTARGEEAVARVAELSPDLVLMDVHLAGEIDGVEAARRIAEAERIPIIFITAYGDGETLARIEATVPGSAVLQKPINADALRHAIAKAAARRAN